jgi:pyruvate dehydrogenase E2 component (dihydrolipoamide acetyltransferase)
MATKVTMEALSPTMEEGRLVKWNKNEGDEVKSGDVLAEVETDKAVMELVARGDGVLRKRIANEGDASPVGTLLAVIGTKDENIDAIIGGAAPASSPAPAAAAAPAAASAPAATAKPAEGNAAPESSDQSQTETPAAAPASTPQKAAAPAATAPPPPRPAAPRPAAPPAPPKGNGARPGATAAPGGRQRSSPLARRLANDKGIQLGSIQGSGPGGRIVKRDIENAKATAAAAGAAARSAAADRLATEGDFKDVPLTLIRKTIARRLAESNGPVPTFFLTSELDATRASEMRTQLLEMGEQYKASFNDIIIKAVALALGEHPEVNAHWLTDKIRHFNRIHVAMAVAVEDGLITPVLFDADRLSLWEISGKARELAKKARERKLLPEEYTGGTFTVSNLGMFGIDQFTAIINPPEAGILAIGGVEEKPVVIEGQLEVRQRMRVTMSCDHRAIDGATGAKFLQTVKRYFENPLSLII